MQSRIMLHALSLNDTLLSVAVAVDIHLEPRHIVGKRKETK